MDVCSEIGCHQKILPYGIGLWKGIRRGWSVFKIHMRFLVDNDTKVRNVVYITFGVGRRCCGWLFKLLLGLHCIEELQSATTSR